VETFGREFFAFLWLYKVFKFESDLKLYYLTMASKQAFITLDAYLLHLIEYYKNIVHASTEYMKFLNNNEEWSVDVYLSNYIALCIPKHYIKIQQAINVLNQHSDQHTELRICHNNLNIKWHVAYESDDSTTKLSLREELIHSIDKFEQLIKNLPEIKINIKEEIVITKT
jgi:hypothetical protein